MGRALRILHPTAAVLSDHELWRDAICSLLRETRSVEVIATGSLTDFPPVAHGARRPDVLLVILANPSLDAIRSASDVRGEYPSSKLIIISAIEPENPIFLYLMKARPDAYLGRCSSGTDLVRAVHVVASGGTWLSTKAIFRDQQVHDGLEGRLQLLTVRECEVLGLIVRSHTNAEIAGLLFISTHTVKAHVQHIFDKLGVSSRSQLIARARNQALFQAD